MKLGQQSASAGNRVCRSFPLRPRPHFVTRETMAFQLLGNDVIDEIARDVHETQSCRYVRIVAHNWIVSEDVLAVFARELLKEGVQLSHPGFVDFKVFLSWVSDTYNNTIYQQVTSVVTFPTFKAMLRKLRACRHD